MKTPYLFREFARKLSAYTALSLATLVLLPAGIAAQTTFYTLANPNWNITLSDYGYSDYLLDNTPGFEGREYLSGEWGAAVGYTVGGTPVAPTWLDPDWWYPDWTTNSTFSVISSINQTGLNADGLPIAEAVIGNSHLRITLRFEMLDTVTGTPMGTTALSAGGAGSHLKSNRYVLKHTYTIKNISGSPITDLQYFQFLHGLTSQRGLQDNRSYAGPLSEYLNDTTLAGIDPWSAGANSSSGGLEDYIGFHSITAPDGFEIGYYGIEGNGVDNHGIGKPSDGVHLSVEDNWTSEPYLSRLGTDAFAPPQRWIAGAQRWTLGSLAANQSVAHEVLLTILTGTSVSTGTGSTGSCNGGSSVTGGIDYEFEDVTSEGSCFGSYSQAEDTEIEFRILEGEFGDITFMTPGNPKQVWEVDFTGTYDGSVFLTFGYDDTVLPAGFDEESLSLYHYTGGAWQELACTIDTAMNTIWVSTPTLGAFIMGINGSGSVMTYDILTSESPVSSGTTAGGGTFAAGSSVALSAVPQAGYAFVNWTENGSPVSSSPNLNFIAAANRDLVANFILLDGDNAIITSSSPAEGGSTTGGGAYPADALATVSAVAAPGYKFSKWKEGDVAVSSVEDYSFTVTGDRNLVAKFVQVYVISVSMSPAEGGDDIEVDPVYELGEQAKVKAVPASGWAFVNWTQNGVVVSKLQIYTFTVTGNRTLVANFAPGYRIDATAEPTAGGVVDGAGVYDVGNPVVLTATAAPGYIFQNWAEASVPISTDPVLSFASSANRTLVANFLALPAITMETPASGTMVIAWPAGATGWVLEESSDMEPSGWTESTLPVITVGPLNQVEVDTTSGPTFFRLAHP